MNKTRKVNGCVEKTNKKQIVTLGKVSIKTLGPGDHLFEGPRQGSLVVDCITSLTKVSTGTLGVCAKGVENFTVLGPRGC